MGRQRQKAVKATAYHEAGHVIISLEYNRPFKHVTIVPTDRNYGGLQRHSDIVIDDLEPIAVTAELSILLAGYAAENRAGLSSKKEIRQGMDNDAMEALNLIRVRYPEITVGGMHQIVDPILIETEKKIDLRWQEVELIAKALLREKTLTYERVWEIINSQSCS